MNDYFEILKDNLNLNHYNFIKVYNNKFLVFKTYTKYTKCIYIDIINDNINIKIDKVFDSMYYPFYIERLLINTNTFNDVYDSIKYIQKNIAI